jgi:serine/threonine-protein kinase
MIASPTASFFCIFLNTKNRQVIEVGFMSDDLMSVDQLSQRAQELEILSTLQLQQTWAELGTRNTDPETFLQTLIRQGHLTNYQVERLVNDETTGFYYGDYKVLYMVGAGSFARVFRASHKETKKVVAVKVLRARFSDNLTVINHFVHEGELGCDLRHPNIVPIYEVQSKGKLHYMVMDFVEGQTLREFLKIRKVIDAKFTTRIVTDVCAALDYAAKRGLQHRDLKLSNVLLSSSGKAQLVDFGLAAISDKIDSNHPDFRNQRAIDYAALERATRVRRDDPRSDLYFLGTIYYHMLSGVAPLVETRERSKRLDKNRFTKVKPIRKVAPDVPHAVAFIVNKLMSLDPDRRYQSPAELLDDLHAAAKRLAEGTADDVPESTSEISSIAATTMEPAKKKLAVMVVESDPDMQNILRQGLKKAGYRALIIGNPERAVERFIDDQNIADCAIFNAQSIGMEAVESFNLLEDDNRTKEIPCILLLEDNQLKWAKKAQTAEHRLVVGMPLTMRKLRLLLLKLLEPEEFEKMVAEAKSSAPAGPPKTTSKEKPPTGESPEAPGQAARPEKDTSSHQSGGEQREEASTKKEPPVADPEEVDDGDEADKLALEALSSTDLPSPEPPAPADEEEESNGEDDEEDRPE